MDPITALGAAGSVVGIADVAFQLVKSISKAYAEIASTEVVLGSIIDEVESMGAALNQISDLISTEERNVKQGLGFKLFTPLALSDVRKTAEKCLVIFWRIEGIILETAGTSEFEKEIQTRRAEFRRHVRSKGKATGSEFGLTKGLADAATSFFRRVRWQFKGVLPKLKEYSDQLRGYQLVFTVMLATISLQTSQQQHDWNAIIIALTQISTVDKQTPISDVLADLSAGDEKQPGWSSHKNTGEGADVPNDHLNASSILGSVPEHLTTRMTENGTAISPVSTQTHSRQPEIKDNRQEVYLASSNDTGQREETLAQSLSDGKPAIENQYQRATTKEKVENLGKLSNIPDSGTKMPEDSLSTSQAEDTDGEAVNREYHQVNKDALMADSRAPETPKALPYQTLSSGVAAFRELNDPIESPKSTSPSIRNVSPSAILNRLDYTEEQSRGAAGSQNTANSTSDSPGGDESNNQRGSGDQSRLVFIVKEGSAQPAPPLSSRGLNRSLTGRFTLRSPRDLGYREFAFLNDLDRKAIESLLEGAKPSKQASVQMKILKKSSLLGFGRAKYAVLVIIEEPGKNEKTKEPLAESSSGRKSTAQNGFKLARDGEIGDEDYFRELTTYKTISIHPLLDVRRPKISMDKIEWENCARAEVTLDRAEVLRRLARIDKDGLSVADKRESLNSQQRLQIRMALVEASRANTDPRNFEWTIRQLELIRKRVHLWSLTPVTVAVVAYLQRSPRPHADLESLFAARQSRPFSLSGPPALEYPKKGKTRIPSRLVSKRALIDLGYQFVEEGDKIIVLRALGQENIDDLLKLSENYKKNGLDPITRRSEAGNIIQETRETADAYRPPQFQMMHGFSPPGEVPPLPVARTLPPFHARPPPRRLAFPPPSSPPPAVFDRHARQARNETDVRVMNMSVTSEGSRPSSKPSVISSEHLNKTSHPHQTAAEEVVDKTAYTRMARRHLSLECLRIRGIDYELDEDPEYVLIKRRVPRAEQRELWSLTKVIRDGREKATTTLGIEPQSHHHRHHNTDDNLVLVRKTKRERSRSPNHMIFTSPVSALRAIPPPDRFPASVSQQSSRAASVPKVAFPGVDKEIVDMLLRRWTPGAAKVSDGSEGWGSENEEDVETEQNHEEHQLSDKAGESGIMRQ